MSDQTPLGNNNKVEQPTESAERNPIIEAQVTGKPVGSPQSQQETEATYQPPPTANSVSVIAPPPDKNTKVESNKEGRLSLVLGILSIVLSGPVTGLFWIIISIVLSGPAIAPTFGTISIVLCENVVGLILGSLAVIFDRQSKKLTPEGTPNGKVTGGIVTGIIGIVLSIIVVITVLVGILTLNYPLKPNQEDVIQTTVAAALDEACTPNKATITELSSDLESEFKSKTGFSLSEIGVSSDELATWFLTDASYEMKNTIIYSNTAQTFTKVKVRDSHECLRLFGADYITWIQSSEYASITDPAVVKAKIGNIMRAAMDKTPMTYIYVNVNSKIAGEKWVVSKSEEARIKKKIFSLEES